jgi:hypothetical protein
MSANNRTRVISQSKAVYIAPTGWTFNGTQTTVEAAQLHGVDTLSFEMDLAGSRQDVREFGQLARIGTVRMSEINPTLSFGYYLQDGANELGLGFTHSAGTSQCIAGMLNEDPTKRESNLFVLTATEGDDAFGYTTGDASQQADAFEAARPSHDLIGFGNAFVSSYSVNMSVGEIPRADVEMQASNVVFYQDIHSGIVPPSLNLDGSRAKPDDLDANIKLPIPTVCDDLAGGLKVLKPHDVTIAFSSNLGVTSGPNETGIGGQSFTTTINAVQSCSIDLPLSREIIDAIGSQLAYAKPLEFPIDVTLSISALVSQFGQGALENALTGTAGDRTTTITVTLKNANDANEMVFILKGAVLDSQSFSQGLDDNETVDLTFSAQIGGATTTEQGLFMTLAGTDPRPTQATFEVPNQAGQPIGPIT